METAATVFLIDDDEPTRDALCLQFRSAGLQVESFVSANDFLEKLPADRRGCVVTDVRMPGLSGLDLQRHLVDRGIGLPVIVMTAFGDVRMAVRAMRAGAFDFVEKPFDGQELIDAVRDALNASADITGREETRARVQERMGMLTERERQVLDLVLEGEPNKRIAYTLGISQKTVEFHRANLIAKLDARSTADLIRKVVAAGHS